MRIRNLEASSIHHDLPSTLVSLCNHQFNPLSWVYLLVLPLFSLLFLFFFQVSPHKSFPVVVYQKSKNPILPPPEGEEEGKTNSSLSKGRGGGKKKSCFLFLLHILHGLSNRFTKREERGREGGGRFKLLPFLRSLTHSMRYLFR